jgi:hypothetical protein
MTSVSIYQDRGTAGPARRRPLAPATDCDLGGNTETDPSGRGIRLDVTRGIVSSSFAEFLAAPEAKSCENRVSVAGEQLLPRAAYGKLMVLRQRALAGSSSVNRYSRELGEKLVKPA